MRGESSGSARTTPTLHPAAAQYSRQLCPLPRPASPGAYLPPEPPRGCPGAGRGAARSRRVPRRPGGPRASWLRGARSRGLRGGRTAREPGKEGGGERGREGGGSRGEGAAGRGSCRSPPERTRAQPRDRSGRAAPGAGGRVRRSPRASERASERGAGGRREGAGAESVPSERGQEGRGRAGPGCQPPPVAAGPSALQSLTPVPLASWGPRASSRRMLWQPCAGAARLKSVRTIFQTVRWRPPS